MVVLYCVKCFNDFASIIVVSLNGWWCVAKNLAMQIKLRETR